MSAIREVVERVTSTINSIAASFDDVEIGFAIKLHITPKKQRPRFSARGSGARIWAITGANSMRNEVLTALG